MPGSGLILCVLAPFALLGLLWVVQIRLVLAQQCARALAPSWREPEGWWEGSPWRRAALAAVNVLLPLLASCFGLAALASPLGMPAFVSAGLHGLNVLQAALGLGLLAQLLWHRKPGHRR
jgi:hypothetical protein